MEVILVYLANFFFPDDCFRINGELHHLSGSLLPENGENESYAQIYIHDPAVQLDMRNRLNQNLDPIIMSNLQAMLNETHPYAQLYTGISYYA